MRLSSIALAAGIAISAGSLFAQDAAPAPAPDAPAGPYKVLSSNKVGGEGGFDYVFADSASRKLFIPRSGGRGAAGAVARIDVYDLDSVKLLGTVTGAKGGHGVAVDPATGHGFASSNPVIMFDTGTLQTIKSIQVEGNPDGIFFEPATEHIFVLSHAQPNVTVLDAKDGSIVGTIDLGGSPEEGASDGKGKCYIDLEDKGAVAVVDATANKVVTTYPLGDKGDGPGGLALDAANGIIFAYCHSQNCVILNAADGKILDTLPIGNGVDAAEFNPNTLEAFSSQGDGTLTIIKENSPTSFAVEETVKTKVGGKCSTIDLKTGNVFITAADRATRPPRGQAAPDAAAGGAAPGGAPAGGNNAGGAAAGGGGGGGGGGRRGGGRGGATVPGSFTIVVVGKS
jgi:hypothetical protein